MPDSAPEAHDDVAIIGAGAAGLATAAFLKRRNPSLSVTLFEGAKKPGAKILVSGGSRCNVTNAHVSERDFWGGSRASIRKVLAAFSVADTREWFSRLGVSLHEEPLGKLFPDTNRSRDVLDALLREVASAGVILKAEHRVTGITREGDSFAIETSHGTFNARSVVLATGGRALPKSGSDGFGYTLAERLGHSLVAQTPALAPLVVASDEPAHAALSGVTLPAELTVWVGGRVAERVRGSMLWTHFGVSGPAALDASRIWARGRVEGHASAITVSLVPGETYESIDRSLQELARDRPKASVITLLNTRFPASVSEVIADACQLARHLPGHQLDRDSRKRLAQALTAWPLQVTDTRGYTYAEATAGGVSLAEIDPGTMASRRCDGLWLVGEVLDVDGRLGGFNFQWAWSSAFVAAKALARR